MFITCICFSWSITISFQNVSLGSITVSILNDSFGSIIISFLVVSLGQLQLVSWMFPSVQL